MPLSAGDKLGPYEVLSAIGAGGMGEVYRATDTRLHREVAVKISAERFSERFEREAKAIASLNHPNICTLHDVGPNYLVMELVEGPTLAERINQGPIPLDEALKIARQIGDALEAAHEKGIVHRDLKPGNVKIKPDGTVKVLDFGLAKMGGAPASPSENSPTLTMGETKAGVILGTAAYMAPEQARGKQVDKRADIWSFGVVLNEMVTGRRLFRGEDLTEVLASVIKEEPRWDAVPPKLQRLLRACLEKDPKLRLRDIGDAWRLLEEPPPPSTAASDPSRPRVGTGGWIAAGVFALAAAAVSVVHFREQAPVAEPVRFEVPPPAKNNFDVYLALSPNGRHLAFTATGVDGLIRIWVRDLETLEARPLNGTEGAGSLMWSPDSRAIAFGVGQQLKKVDIAGGPPLTLCASPNTVGSGAWSKSGMIVFGGRGAGPLRQVSEAGGAPSPVTELEGGGYHSFPSFLADGRHFVYYRSAGGVEKAGIYLGSLDSKPHDQSSKRMLATSFGAVYGPSPNGGSGRVLFLRDGTLMAQPFDEKRLEFAGEAVPVAEHVGSTNQYGNFSAAENGSLVYRTGSAGNTQLTWLDSQGKALNPVGEPGQYAMMALAPDATRAVFRRTGGGDLWLMEFAHGVSTRFTFTQQGLNDYPVWSPDGKYVVFASNRTGRYELYRKTANGAGEDELLLQTDQDKFPTSWSRDGRFLLYNSIDQKTARDIWVLPMEGDRKQIPFLRTEFDEGWGAFSSDAHWIAYVSGESGSFELFVRPFTAPGSGSPGAAAGKWQVSKGGALTATPFWRADGKELYYRSPSGALMAVDVNASPTFQSGAPHRLFDVLAAAPLGVTADGKRFLAAVPQQESGPQAITVVLNWQAGLKR